jgi:hypothetical protein
VHSPVPASRFSHGGPELGSMATRDVLACTSGALSQFTIDIFNINSKTSIVNCETVRYSKLHFLVSLLCLIKKPCGSNKPWLDFWR